MDTDNHFGFAGLPPAPTASGLKPTAPSSGDNPYSNGAALSFPPQGKSEYGGQAGGACSRGVLVLYVRPWAVPMGPGGLGGVTKHSCGGLPGGGLLCAPQPKMAGLGAVLIPPGPIAGLRVMAVLHPSPNPPFIPALGPPSTINTFASPPPSGLNGGMNVNGFSTVSHTTTSGTFTSSTHSSGPPPTSTTPTTASGTTRSSSPPAASRTAASLSSPSTASPGGPGPPPRGTARTFGPRGRSCGATAPPAPWG